MKRYIIFRTNSGRIKINIALLISLCFPLLLSAQAENKPDSSAFEKFFTIDNCVNEFSMDGTIPTKAGYQYWFIDKDFLDGRTLKMSVVKPGTATHPPHVHTEDEFFFILEGKAEFHLNGETTVAEAYASFYCPADSKHGIKNAGDSSLKYLVIKKYKPE
jgi:quercetin dioxygenase-like cupin family protein